MATFSDLDVLDPRNNDPVSGGAEQLRDIKSTLKDQFLGGTPGSDPEPDGLDAPVYATAAELNSLVGLDPGGTIQEKIEYIGELINKVLGAPDGTQMMFYQAVPPSGWTITTNANDSMLRLVTSGGGTNGGTVTPINLTLSHAHTTANHTLTGDEMPVHGHTVTAAVQQTRNDRGNDPGNNFALNGSQATSFAGGGQPHNHGQTSLALNNWTPRYVNVIKASKDVWVPSP